MPQLAPLTINDGTAGVVFTPRSMKDGVATLVKRGALPLDVQELSVSLRGSDTFGYKPVIKIQIPILGTSPTGQSMVVDTVILQVTGRLPATVSTADRLRARKLLSNALNDAAIVSVLDTMEGIY